MFKNNGSDEISNYDKIKILVLGDTGVGKTSFINHYISLDFPNSKNDDVIKSTIALDLHIKKMISEGDTFIAEFIELAGDYSHIDNYELFLDLFFEEAISNNQETIFDGIIYVFDINNHQSLRHVRRWVNWFYRHMKELLKNNNTDDKKFSKLENKRQLYNRFMEIPILFIANKLDSLYGSTYTVGDMIKDNLKEKIETTHIKIREIIKINFSFNDIRNVVFGCNLSNKEDLHMIDSYVTQIYMKQKGSYNYNTNKLIDHDDFDINQYPLKDFLFLHSIDFIIHRTFMQKVWHMIKQLFDYEYKDTNS